MSIKGFKVNNNIEKYDYEALDNKPDVEGALSSFINIETKNTSGTVSFEMGAISSSNGEDTPSSTRIRTGFIFMKPESVVRVSINENTQRIKVFHYSDTKEYISSDNWDSTAKYILLKEQSAGYIRIIGAYQNDAPISTTDIFAYYNQSTILDDIKWDYGGVKSADGTENDNSELYINRIRSGYADIEHCEGIILTDRSISLYVAYYDSSKTFISADGWFNNNVYLYSGRPANAKYVRLTIKNNNDSAIADILETASKIEFSSVAFESGSEVKERIISLEEKAKELGFPDNFYIIDYDGVSQYGFIEEGTVYKTNNTQETAMFTKMIKMPKYLAFNIPSGYRLNLYVYNKSSSGVYSIDTNYNLTNADGIVNNFDSSKNCALISNGNKYFQYRFFNHDGEDGRTLSMIGCDRWKENESIGFMRYWGIKGSGGTGAATLTSSSSIVVPKRRFFAIKPNSGNNTIGCMRSFSYDSESSDNYNERAYASFGFVNDSHALIFRDGEEMAGYDVYVSDDVITAPMSASKRSVTIANQVNSFEWTCKKAIEFAGNYTEDTDNMFKVGKKYYGVPYSSRWVDAHFICLEISPETALNASNDEYSIWYDKNRQPLGKGPGYGMVCSSYASFVGGSDYPQTNQGFTWDSNFEIAKSEMPVVGSIYSNIYDEKNNGSYTHCVYVSDAYKDGYALMEALSPLTNKTIHTINNDEMTFPNGFRVNIRERYLSEYGWTCNLLHRYGFDSNAHVFTNFNVTVANGSVRPYRGNKSVYGSFDKSVNGSGIKITIHDNASTAYMKTPGGTVKSYQVQGRTVIDVSSDVTEDGTYELYSDVSNTKEYFRYRVHDDVTVHIDESGNAVFSHNDVDYCYANEIAGCGKGLEYLIGNQHGDVCLANSYKYKACKYKGLTINNVSAAMVYDEWGMYSVVCSVV